MVNRIKKAGIIGFPVSHSLSPRLHSYWLKRYNIAGEYSSYPIELENLPEFIQKIRDDRDFCGVNITIPHKEAVMRLLDEVDDLAKVIGAVNTIIIEDGKLRGINTDAYGFVENIRSHISGRKKAVVLGAGGAAKAVIYALQQLGFEEIVITNRTKDKAKFLSSVVSRQLSVEDWEKRSDILADADLLVNTTSLGMKDKKQLEISLELLPKNAMVTDIVYNPLLTHLLVQAQTRGNRIVDGLGMLLHQAVPAFEAWFGKKPEVTKDLRQYMLDSE